ncbi:hypothetical protein J3R82DRAFT_8876 [Butyriboletus roseoflavus]|nr:hypothetical protein J3R82DRAFT_8876 [Butyriboletus roseoflavus]
MSRMHRIKQINFYHIPAQKLTNLISELCESDSDNELLYGESTPFKAAFNIKTVQKFCGHIRIEVTQVALLGIEAFRTAQAIELTLSPLRPSGLGSIPNQLITAKCLFHNPSDSINDPPYIWLSMGDEFQQLYHNVNILYWAIALLNLVYDYIDQCVINTKILPPFNIPHLYFVKAGLLFAYSADQFFCSVMKIG